MLFHHSQRLICLFVCIVMLAVPLLLPGGYASADTDPRFFGETGYRIEDERFWNYFNQRGGVRAFGFPVSRAFTLMGFRVQIFQRRILQIGAAGNVTQLNFLDDLLPYTHINGSVFPALDPARATSAPKPSDSNYAIQVIEFVRTNSPDSFEGVPVRFYQTFLNTVSAADAFPNGGNLALLPLINLELWGVPVSAPQRDPSNPNFIFLRFQRGVMHYDAATGQTLGLLLADYFKAVLTGKNLPPDLEQAASTSRFYRQYAPGTPNALARPAQLPGTDLTDAFEQQQPVIGTLAVTSHSSYTDGAGVRHIVGEVQNGTGNSYESIEIIATAGGVSARGFAYCSVLAPGEKAPFHLQIRSAGGGEPGFTVRSIAATRPATTLQVEGSFEGTGTNLYRVSGRVTNNSGGGIRRVGVAITLFDGSGRVVGTALVFTNPSDMQPGSTGTFETTVDTAGTATSYALRASGY